MLRLWLGCDEYRIVGRRSLLAAACLFGGIVAVNVADAQQARTRFPIGSASVIAAMEGKQLPTKDVSVSMAMAITARTAYPQLEIQAVTKVGTHEMRLRVGCRDHNECLTFFATATYPEAVDDKALPVKHEPVGPATPVPEKHVPPANVANANTTAAGRGAASATAILKAGSAAKLDIEGDRIHIQMDVICLADGAAGDKIRVTSRDRKQTYVAQIVTPTLLKGSL